MYLGRMDYSREIKKRARLAVEDVHNGIEHALIAVALKAAWDVERAELKTDASSSLGSLSEFDTEPSESLPLKYSTGERIEKGDVVTTHLHKKSSLIVDRIEGGVVYIASPNKKWSTRIRPESITLVKKAQDVTFTRSQMMEAIRKASQFGEHGMIPGDDESILLDVMSREK